MIIIEFFGVPRLKAGKAQLSLNASTLQQALSGLGLACPELANTVLLEGAIHPAYRLNLNGERFVSDPSTPLKEGDVLILLSADVGG